MPRASKFVRKNPVLLQPIKVCVGKPYRSRQENLCCPARTPSPSSKESADVWPLSQTVGAIGLRLCKSRWTWTLQNTRTPHLHSPAMQHGAAATRRHGPGHADPRRLQMPKQKPKSRPFANAIRALPGWPKAVAGLLCDLKSQLASQPL